MDHSDKPSGIGTRLGTKLRGKLGDAYTARARLTSKLAYAYSPRMRQDVVLKSDLEFWHFILAESDPLISAIDYNPDKEVVTVGDDVHGTVLDAVVQIKDGTVEWREIKYSDDTSKRTEHQREAQEQAAYRSGAKYRRFTEKEIFNCPQRISNWLDVVAWLSAVRDRHFLEYDLAVSHLLRVSGTVTIAEIQALTGVKPLSSCYVAAAFRKVQDGVFYSDLDYRPLTGRTLISLSEVRNMP